MQSQHDTFALLGMFFISLASIHMVVGSQVSIFDFFVTCVELRFFISVIAGKEMQSQHDTFALLGMLSLSPTMTRMATRVRCSPCDLFDACIVLRSYTSDFRSCTSMAASEDVQSRSGIAAHWVLALTSAFIDATSWYLFIPAILLMALTLLRLCPWIR